MYACVLSRKIILETPFAPASLRLHLLRDDTPQALIIFFSIICLLIFIKLASRICGRKDGTCSQKDIKTIASLNFTLVGLG